MEKKLLALENELAYLKINLRSSARFFPMNDTGCLTSFTGFYL